MRAPILAIRRTPDRNVDGLLLDLIADDHDAKKCARGARTDVNFLSCTVLFDSGAEGNQIELHCHIRSSLRGRRILAHPLRRLGQEGRRRARRSAAAESVSSLLQNVKRTWRAPSAASL